MIDKRLTEEEKKKIKPANQGGGPNYLGKQETVTVPKKWLSSPDHVVAELAYITPREQKILLNADIYGSLKGKPNKGPGGIMSLQGDMGSVGGGSSNGGGNDRPNIGEISGPVTSSFTDADDNRQNYKTDQYTTGPTTTDPDETTIDELTTTFAPTVTKPSIWDGIKTIGKTLVKGYVAAQTFGALGLSPKAVAIGNTALGFTNDIGLTKSRSISELGLNTASSIGDVFSGNTNRGVNTNSFSENTNSFSGNTNSLSDNNQNNDGEGGNNNNVLSNEYILLLQKMQLGNFTQEDQTRFNLLKTMLGK